MTIIELLQASIDYIEENLKCYLSVQEIATKIGFSVYHFSRIFNDYVGMPVSAYITKRRLLHIVYDSSKSNKLVDTALLYGFDTYAGFYKAFKKEFGCTPSKYFKLNTVKKPMVINLNREANLMLTQTQIRQLLQKWDIHTKLEVESTLIAGGSKKANNAWIVGDKYIFKTGKNISGLKTHIEITKALANLSLESSYPILTKEGKDFIIQDDRYYILLNKVEGEFLTKEERYEGNRFNTGLIYGEAIGKLHKILKEQDNNLEVDDTNLIDIVLNWALPESKKIMEQWNSSLPDEFYENYTENFSKYYHKLPRQIIHRDPNPSNIMFKDRRVTGFIDFEISERNVRIFDPCYCATGILSETDNIDEGFEKWVEIQEGIVKGYDNICGLTDIEKLAIPYIMYSIQMIFIAWLNGKNEYKDLALKNRNILLKIYNYFSINEESPI